MLCSVVVAELLVGALKSRRQADTLQAVRNFTSMFASLPFNDACAEQYARIRALLEKSGQIIGPNDLMIAATALANDCALVTHNVSEFGRIQGLQIENWQF